MPCEPAPTWPRPPEPTVVVRRGLETAAPSVLQDGVAGDHHDCPIAEGRYTDSGCGGDEAPARPVPVLDAHRTSCPDVAGGDGRDRPEVVAVLRVRVGAADLAPARAVPVLNDRPPPK